MFSAKELCDGNKDAGAKEYQREQKGPTSCLKVGHGASRCPTSAATFYGGRAKKPKVKDGHSSLCRAGYVEGKEVKDIVLDTSAARTLVRDNLVSRNKCLDKFVSVQCGHGNNVSYPLATVEVVVDCKSYFVEAAVVKKLLCGSSCGEEATLWKQLW